MKRIRAIRTSLPGDAWANALSRVMGSRERMSEDGVKNEVQTAVTVIEKPLPQQRIECLSEQIHDYQAGYIRKIGCPYCGASNRKGEICCALFEKATAAILDHDEMLKEQQIIDRVGVPGRAVRIVN